MPCEECEGKLYVDTWVCPSCKGTKVSDYDPFPHCTDCLNKGVVHDAPVPCRTCLAYPATDEVRELALDWLGFQPWDLRDPARVEDDRTTGWPWLNGTGPRSFGVGWVIPLGLPAGYALALRLLAQRHGDTGAQAYWLDLDWSRKGWHLRSERGRVSGFWHNVPPDLEKDWIRVPGLDTIPDTAPPHLRLARVATLCLQATPPRSPLGF